MTPVFQKVSGPKGDCLHACVASLFDLPYEEAFGFKLPPIVEVLLDELDSAVRYVNESVPESFYAIIGTAVDDLDNYHAVIGLVTNTPTELSIDIVHDPAGLFEDKSRYTLRSIMFLVPLKNSIAVKI